MSTAGVNETYPSLQDRVVIVTGGGRGLGREMALALVEAGARVAITGSREAGELNEVEDEANRLVGGGRMAAIQADVRKYEDCERTMRQVFDAFGAVHCLVNNAGRGLLAINPDFGRNPIPFYEASAFGWQEIIETNVLGPFHMARAAAPHMVEQGFGKIINISTSDVTMVRRSFSPYGPSKAAVEANSVVWAQDLEGTGVTVNVFLPGGASDTQLLPDMENKAGADGQLLSPEIMRAPILWLCADQSNGHTGERYIAKLWDGSLPPDEAAAMARQRRHKKPAIM